MTDLIAAFLAWLGSLFGGKHTTTTPPPVVQPPPVNVISRLTDFRKAPTVSAQLVEKVLTDAHSPMSAEAAEIHAAILGNPVPLAQSFAESIYGTSDVAVQYKNPLGLLWYEGSPVTRYASVTVNGHTIRPLIFDTYADAFKEWQRRMSDPKYKGGVYPQGATIEDFAYIYVGGPGCKEDASKCGNGETQANCKKYGDELVDRVNRYYTLDPGGVIPPAQQLTFGRVPLPEFTDRRIPDKKNRAWDLLGNRVTIRGVVLHRMLGSLTSTDSYFRTVPNGNAANCPAGVDTTYINGGCNGLTDLGIDATTGDADMWNSPLGFPASGVSANRSPWASGPYASGGADGIAFVNKFGINAINRDLKSIEVSGQYNDPISERCKATIVAFVAYFADQAKVPWHTFPMNPATGETFLFFHWEFCGKATKICPGPVIEAFLDELIQRVIAILKQYQTGAGS